MEEDEAGLAQGESEGGFHDDVTTTIGTEAGDKLKLFFPV